MIGNCLGHIALRVIPVALLGILAPAILSAPAHAATLGRYCSVTWPSGGWALKFYNNLTNDPCGEINAQWPGGMIQRSGLYSASGVTNVVARCGMNGYVIMFQGVGTGPLAAAYNQAVADKQTGCTFTAAPRDLPVFVSPIDPGTPGLSHATGVDFARDSYGTLDTVTEFGQPWTSLQSAGSPIVDWKGRDKSSPAGYIDNHEGHDLPMPVGTKVVAVAAGRVVAARFRDISKVGCSYSISQQGEVWIEHTISGATGQVVPFGSPTTIYDEKLITFYAHFNTNQIIASEGLIVKQGDTLGYSGNTGCSNPAHLHFGTMRTTNTAGHYRFPVEIYSDFTGTEQRSANIGPVIIDPFGFMAPKGFDPWAWRAFPNGALSINLWSGPTFGTGNW